jgi:hypothetical protein
MACTVPWPFRKWFESRFADLCHAHDDAYVKRIWHAKVVSDYVLALHIADRGYGWLAFCSIIYNVTLGTIYWWWKKCVS